MERRTWYEISLSAILSNIRRIRKHTGRRYLSCVKADGYGLGAVPVARAVAPVADYFGVATLGEALELREAGICKPILILCPLLGKDLPQAIRSSFTIPLYSRRQLAELERVTGRLGTRATVHIKVDTGLGRIGFLPEELEDCLEDIAGARGIRVEGIYSHFSTAKEKDRRYADLQMDRFAAAVRTAEARLRIPLRHLSNSAAVLNLPRSFRDFDMVRVGILQYGIYPEPRFYDRLHLRCAVALFSRILLVREVPARTGVGYGRAFTTRRKTTIGIVGMGYADGLFSALSNNFSFTFGHRRLPILGNVCMDQTIVDLTGTGAKVGDVVRAFGTYPEIEEFSQRAGVSVDETLLAFQGRRVERVYRP